MAIGISIGASTPASLDTETVRSGAIDCEA